MTKQLGARLGLAITAALFAAAAAQAQTPQVSVKLFDGHADFLAGGQLVARYHHASKAQPLAKPYFWPIRGPGGVEMTRAWPMRDKKPGETADHIHQKSAWFCHGDIIPRGFELKEKVKGVEGVDFWSESPGHGRIVCTKVKPGPAAGELTTHNEWRTAGSEKIMDESRTIRLFALGEATLIVLDIDLCASVVPLTFGDTKEGSFGIRINDRLRESAGLGQLENADGKKGEKLCWGQRSDWCDYSGTLDGKKVGLAILDDPGNPHRACWHSRGYGLMAANPFGRGHSGFPAMKGRSDLAEIEKGEHLKLRYGLLIHPGDAKEGQVAGLFDQFVKLKDR